jgi:restriction system protein
MALPNFQQLMLPTLRHICQVNDDVQIVALEREIALTLALSTEDLSRVLPSGQQSVFSNRLNWARSYMTKAGLLEAPRRSYCRATQRAHDLLAEASKEIDLTILSRYPEFVAWRSQQKSEDPAPTSDARSNPEELIAINFERLNRDLAVELAQRVHSFSPAFFERMIVDLLVRMGYGGGRSEMGRALGRIGDGGIDGVIKEDELGLDVVYVQAKRFEPERQVPLREVRDFVGALEGHRASKGVFVTTSHFPEARMNSSPGFRTGSS